jgi:hypothetical protein
MNRVLVFDKQIHDAPVRIVRRVIFWVGYKSLTPTDYGGGASEAWPDG